MKKAWGVLFGLLIIAALALMIRFVVMGVPFVTGNMFYQIYWGNFLASLCSTVIFWSIPVIITLVFRRNVKEIYDKVIKGKKK